MARLVDGQWSGLWKPTDGDDGDGRFRRPETSFRRSLPASIEPGRYCLYVAWTCPWAHRTLLVRALKGLGPLIDVHHCDELTDQSWRFAAGPEPLYGAGHLYELYLRADPRYTGRVTVPVLWDAIEHTVVNNESAEIMRQLDALPSAAPALSPPHLHAALDAMDVRLYEPLNNGVYRAGFARSQTAYDDAVADVFATLDDLEQHLEGRDWLVGDQLTEADLKLFATLFRFDAAYYTLFKCNLRRVAAYPNLSAHLVRVLSLPGVAATCDLDAARRGYAAIRAINPQGIVPIGPPSAF